MAPVDVWDTNEGGPQRVTPVGSILEDRSVHPIHCRVARSSVSGHSGSRSKLITSRLPWRLAVPTGVPEARSEHRHSLYSILNVDIIKKSL